MADLITRARALYNLNNLASSSDENNTLDALIAACSRAIRRYCRREFDSQEFDQLYSGTRSEILMLREFPILKVTRVAQDPTTVLIVQNTASTNQRATVRVTATGLELIRTSSGTVSTDTSVTWAGNATLNAVKSAVDALGNGWSASVTAGFENWRSNDLRDFQGHLNALGAAAALKLHVNELDDFEIDDRKGWLIRSEGWPGGTQHWRIIYTAGYASVPEDVQEACAQWVASLFWMTKRDPLAQSQSVPGQVSQHWPTLGRIPPGVQALLETYRNHTL